MESNYKKPPKLFHEPAMSFDEIAQATGMTINQVRHMVNMALIKLKKQAQAQGLSIHDIKGKSIDQRTRIYINNYD